MSSLRSDQKLWWWPPDTGTVRENVSLSLILHISINLFTSNIAEIAMWAALHSLDTLTDIKSNPSNNLRTSYNILLSIFIGPQLVAFSHLPARQSVRAAAGNKKKYFRNQLSMFCWVMFVKIPVGGGPVSNHSLGVIKLIISFSAPTPVSVHRREATRFEGRSILNFSLCPPATSVRPCRHFIVRIYVVWEMSGKMS